MAAPGRRDGSPRILRAATGCVCRVWRRNSHRRISHWCTCSCWRRLTTDLFLYPSPESKNGNVYTLSVDLIRIFKNADMKDDGWEPVWGGGGGYLSAINSLYLPSIKLHLRSSFTFRYGMHAVRMASTVKLERAKPTKYVCSGTRPSLNNHLGGEQRSIWLQKLLIQIRVSSLRLCSATDVKAFSLGSEVHSPESWVDFFLGQISLHVQTHNQKHDWNIRNKYQEHKH